MPAPAAPPRARHPLLVIRPAPTAAVQEEEGEGEGGIQIDPKPVADEKLDSAEVAISEDEKTKTLASCDLEPQVDSPAPSRLLALTT